MYSWEIQNLIEMRNALLEYQEYLKVIGESPQINYVEYLKQGDQIHITTDDNYDFKFKVKRYEKKGEAQWKKD